MGLGGVAAGAALDALGKQAEMKRLLEGRTPEQQQAIKYLYGAGGCMSKTISDDEYESMVMQKAKSIDFKKKALDKIGLDESQVNEVPPVHFEDYEFDDKNAVAIRGKDGVWRSSTYEITWIFFGASQIYVYSYRFNMHGDEKKERTEEYFYKDITNFNTTSDTVEKESAQTKGGCMGAKTTWVRTNVDTNRFQLSAMGDKFFCAMKQNDYTEKAIQGMKAKLREKKGYIGYVMVQMPTEWEQDVAAVYVKKRRLVRPDTNLKSLFIWIMVFALVTCIIVGLVYHVFITVGIVTYLPSVMQDFYNAHPVFITCVSVIAIEMFWGFKCAVIVAIKLYQHYAPENIRRRCLFKPTCSEYAIMAVEKYGVIVGLCKTFFRVMFLCRGNVYSIHYPWDKKIKK